MSRVILSLVFVSSKLLSMMRISSSERASRSNPTSASIGLTMPKMLWKRFSALKDKH